MKKIILLALAWPLCYYPLYAQKDKTKNENREVIIIRSGDKEKKLTIETKDGEVFINGKPSSEYKEKDVSVIKQKFQNDNTIWYPSQSDKFTLLSGANQSFLGVTAEKSNEGVKVTDVSKGSPAEKAGLKEGDVITKIGDKSITDGDRLVAVIADMKPKDEVNIVYKRNGKTNEAKATLANRGLSRAYSFNGSAMGERDFHMAVPRIPTMPHQSMVGSWGFGRGRLGLRIEDTENDNGVKVIEVHDESAALKAGLKENDVITEVNGKAVKNVNEVRKELAEVKDKNNYNIKAKRNGSDMNFEIKIPKKLNKADL